MIYRVMFAEANTGHILTLDGTVHVGHGNPPTVEFVDIVYAREYAQTWLSSRPYAEAWIGDESDPQLEYFISEHFLVYDREKRACEFWKSLPAWRRWFTPRPASTFYREE